MAVASAPPAFAGRTSWLGPGRHRPARVPTWVAVGVIAVLLALSWVAVYESGGSQLTAPHLFYVPIVLAALRFGVRGAVPTAVAASILCGPLVPLVVATAQPQPTAAWVLRGAVFVTVGALAAIALGARQRSYERSLSSDVREALGADLLVRRPDEDLALLIDDVVAARRFHPVFQPVYQLSDGRLLGVEALTRFDAEPQRSPDRWFAAAASVGRGAELEVLAVETALAALGDLPAHVQVSLNVSPRALEDERLLDVLAAHRHRRLVVEITEHAVVEDYQRLLGCLAPVRALGVTVAVDDAGSGFASLRHVVQLAPETIKVDISLAQGLTASPLRRALAGALVEFARATGAQLVVEGVEDVADLRTWSGLGAHAVQGYLLGRPGPLPTLRPSPVITRMHRHGPGRAPGAAAVTPGS